MKITAKLAARGILIAFIFFVVFQFIPYGRNHVNAPVVKEPVWNNTVTKELAKRACFNCHSNETEWPWYSKIAPVSWLIYHDVDEGRSKVNFSDWRPVKGEKFKHEIDEGDMPPIQYRMAHPEARLTPTEKLSLVDGLLATTAGSK